MNSAKKACLLLAATACSLYASAQKKLFTIVEATNGITTTLAPKSVKQPTWQPGTDNFWQMVNTGKQDVLVRTEWPQDKTDTLLTVKSLNGALDEKYKAMPAVKWMDASHAYIVTGNKVERATFTQHAFHWEHWATLQEKADNITVDKNHNLAYTVENNLWLVTDDKRTVQVTDESNKGIVNGQAVHRNEFGIETGIFFSPMGHYLAYYRMDQSMVADYPIVQWDVVPATVKMIKYPMAGRTSHQVTLCVYNISTGRTVTMQTGEEEKDHYLTCVTWSPDEKYIFVAILNRDQNHLWLNKYDATTGEKVKTLFEETSAKYVHPMHLLYFVPGTTNQFVWQSERDGWDHLYLYNTDGELIRKLTEGNWVVNEVVGFNAVSRQVIVTTSKESPLEKHIYSIGLDDATMRRIDDGAGMHTALCSEDGKYVFDSYIGPKTPKNSVMRSTDGAVSKMLISSPDPLADYDRPKIKDVVIKADDGTPLYGKLILPLHFDSTKKYPVIVYLYNGPNVQLIHNAFPESGNLWYEYMAQHGYIVFSMDGRGAWNRGLAFEQVTFRHLGDVEMEDQMQGVNYLKSLRYVDSKRMGLHGWSFGGFMTTSIMLKHPDVFKCAVAGGPVMDWKMYEVMYTERYMDTPDDNPEGYENANLLDKVKNLKGKLLLIHGTNDNVVVWQQSIDFLKKCVDENVQVDYFVYPGYEHNVRGKDRVHLMEKISGYFDEYLKK